MNQRKNNLFFSTNNQYTNNYLNQSFHFPCKARHFDATMASINTFNEGPNIGGIAVLEIAHIQDFLNFDPPLFRDGKDWQEIEFLDESAQLDPDFSEDDNGIVYNYSGVFSVKKPIRIDENAMHPYIGAKSVLRITDQNERVRIIGLPDCPVTIKMKGTTGDRYTSGPANEFSFAVDQPKPALETVLSGVYT